MRSLLSVSFKYLGNISCTFLWHILGSKLHVKTRLTKNSILPYIAGVCEEGGDDPTLQVAQEAGRVAAARLHALQPHGRLRQEVWDVHPQRATDALPLPAG